MCVCVWSFNDIAQLLLAGAIQVKSVLSQQMQGHAVIVLSDTGPGDEFFKAQFAMQDHAESQHCHYIVSMAQADSLM